MSHKIAGMQLGMHWRLDDWPDEVHVSHELTPNVSRVYVDEWRYVRLEALARDMYEALGVCEGVDGQIAKFALRMQALGFEVDR